MDWGLEILWHKDFKCKGICFHRIWLFSGENIAAREEQFKECLQSFQKSFTGFEKVGEKFNPKSLTDFQMLANT